MLARLTSADVHLAAKALPSKAQQQLARSLGVPITVLTSSGKAAELVRRRARRLDTAEGRGSRPRSRRRLRRRDHRRARRSSRPPVVRRPARGARPDLRPLGGSAGGAHAGRDRRRRLQRRRSVCAGARRRPAVRARRPRTGRAGRADAVDRHAGTDGERRRARGEAGATAPAPRVEEGEATGEACGAAVVPEETRTAHRSTRERRATQRDDGRRPVQGRPVATVAGTDASGDGGRQLRRSRVRRRADRRGRPRVHPVPRADRPKATTARCVPCVVIAACAPDSLVVRPCYSEGGARADDWRSVRVTDPRAAGLDKNSYVATQEFVIERAHAEPIRGRLGRDDWNAL